MEFPFGQTVYRDRRARVTDPYNPSKTTEGSWDSSLTITLPGAFIASSTSTRISDATRIEILTDKSLYLTDVTADVQTGDRVRTADMDFATGAGYKVPARPAADTNPFTGWTPAVEIPLELVEG
jgi:hypothetical protein